MASPANDHPAHGTNAALARCRAMPGGLILLLLVGCGYAFWNSSRAATERATELGRNACQAANVQWLDQSVHATGLRLCRMPSGWPGLERSFRFDYSHDGIERHSGRMVLRGTQLVSFIGPTQANNVYDIRG